MREEVGGLRMQQWCDLEVCFTCKCIPLPIDGKSHLHKLSRCSSNDATIIPLYCQLLMLAVEVV